jgi:molybdopterin-containing oxidoreductase family iron-sulfur binding subunit
MLSLCCSIRCCSGSIRTKSITVYDLKGSELVVSFQADFLGDYNASSLETSYAAARKPGANMLRHIQVESNMSLTGANADQDTD